jgi:tetratricopeptide (TPR) repeat protein
VAQRGLQSLLERIDKEPANANARIKIAELYQKSGEKQKALLEHLKVVEIFCDFEQYPKGLAVCTKLLRDNPECEPAKLKLADIYKKMGFLAQAFAQYQALYSSYMICGIEDKALEMIGYMAELDPGKFTLSGVNNSGPQPINEAEAQGTREENNFGALFEDEKRSFFDLATMLESNNPAEIGEPKSVTMEENPGFKDIFEEMNQIKDLNKLYTNYNYQMGMVCKEIGLIDEAIRQFQMALENRQKSDEAEELLRQCLKEKAGGKRPSNHSEYCHTEAAS